MQMAEMVLVVVPVQIVGALNCTGGHQMRQASLIPTQLPLCPSNMHPGLPPPLAVIPLCTPPLTLCRWSRCKASTPTKGGPSSMWF